MTICIIPARGGSKRIPRKNIKLFCGKPMIAWSIQAAENANIFSKIVVSTDDSEIAAIAKAMGAEVPFIRPEKLSDDFTTTGEVMSHACEWIMDMRLKSSVVCCLYPTAPFLQPADLTEAHRVISSGDWNYVFSVGEFRSSVHRAFEQNSKDGIKMLFPENISTRTQDLAKVYHDAGMFYMGALEAWTAGTPIFNKHSFPIKIPSWRVQDIDTHDDWVRAELMAAKLLKDK